MAQVAVPLSMESRQISPRYKWYVVAMLWFICFFNYADRQAIFSIFPVLQEEYGINKEQQGWIGAAFMWVYALSAPFAGQVGDRFPRKYIILGGLGVWSAITGATAFCTKVWQFVLVRATEGLGETFYFPASMSLISDYHTPKTRSRAMSLHQTSVYAGTIGGGALAGWMADHYHWGSSFILLGGLGMVLALVLAAFIREPRRNEAQIEENALEQAALASAKGPAVVERGSHPPLPESTDILSLKDFARLIARTPTVPILITAFFGANFVAFVFISWMPTFLKEKFGLSLTLSGVGATLFIQVASMIGAIAGGFLADSWRKRLPGGRIAVQSVGAILGAPFIFLCGWTDNIQFLMFALTMFGLFKGLYDANIWASLYDVVPASRRGTAVGMMNMIGWLGAGLGTILTGTLAKHEISMSQIISSTAVIYLVVAALLLVAAFVFASADIRRAQQVS